MGLGLVQRHRILLLGLDACSCSCGILSNSIFEFVFCVWIVKGHGAWSGGLEPGITWPGTVLHDSTFSLWWGLSWPAPYPLALWVQSNIPFLTLTCYTAILPHSVQALDVSQGGLKSGAHSWHKPGSHHPTAVGLQHKPWTQQVQASHSPPVQVWVGPNVEAVIPGDCLSAFAWGRGRGDGQSLA